MNAVKQTNTPALIRALLYCFRYVCCVKKQLHIDSKYHSFLNFTMLIYVTTKNAAENGLCTQPKQCALETGNDIFSVLSQQSGDASYVILGHYT
jgi:hypothetical protein